MRSGNPRPLLLKKTVTYECLLQTANKLQFPTKKESIHLLHIYE